MEITQLYQMLLNNDKKNHYSSIPMPSARIQILVLPFNGFVTVGRLINLIVPQFPHLQSATKCNNFIKFIVRIKIINRYKALRTVPGTCCSLFANGCHKNTIITNLIIFLCNFLILVSIYVL